MTALISAVYEGISVSRLTTKEIAEAWRREVLSTAVWKASSNIAGAPVGAPTVGEAGGTFADSAELPQRRVYMKPGVRDIDPTSARAAREKIASDLAYDLGIVVPPVILGHREHPKAENNVCLSLVMYPAAWSWAEVVRKLDGSRPPPKDKAVAALLDKARDALSRAAAHALAFDTWVFQLDHGPHNNHNIVFGYDPRPDGDFAFILLDYAMAFGIGGRWRTPGHPAGPRTCVAAPLHPRMLEAVDKAELSRMISAIENLPESVIATVVERIPDSHLPKVEKDAILTGLRIRQPLLRSALGSYLEKKEP